MIRDKPLHSSRPGFLGESVLAATGAASMAPRAVLATAATTTVLAKALQPAPAETTNAAVSSDKSKLPLRVSGYGYLSFGPEEAGFAEAMVDVMSPADKLTPGGVDCGFAVFIDRQLAGGCVRAETRGWPQTLLAHGRAQAIVITPGYRLHAPSE
jgi:gluconate 2-dehydrogenase gamma chain